MGRISKYLYQLGAILLFIGVLTATSSHAQQQENRQMARFKLADSYLSTGQYQRAIPLLEDLYRSDSTSVVYYRKLKEAYAGVKQYDQAIALVDDRLEINRTPSLMAQKAALLSQKGEMENALDTWREALELAPNRSGTYRTVYLSMIDHRQFDEAITVLQQGRERLEQPRAFAIDLAHLYGLTSKHKAAAEEYLRILADQPDRLPVVKRRLSRYSDQEGALEATLEIIEQRVENEPLHRPYRELAGWLYLRTKQYDRAFDEYRAIDRLEEENGAVLYSFARKAANAEAYQAASKAFERILERYPEMPSAPDAQLGLAEMHRKQAEETNERAFDYSNNRKEPPHYSAALEAYQTFIRNYPNHAEHAATLLEIGLLQLNVFRDVGRAESIFQQLPDRYPESLEASRAELNLGRVAVLRDDLEQAQLIFSRLEDTAESDDITARARYELARLHLYRGHLTSATSLARVLSQNTSDDTANDAIKLKLLLTENKGPDSLNTPLKIYGRAELYERQRRFDMAMSRIDSLLNQYADHSLNDESYFLQAEVYRQQGETTKAADQFLQLSVRYPESPLADRSLYQAAQLYERALKDRQTALETYNRLLEQYPGSLLLPDVRERIRALRSNA